MNNYAKLTAALDVVEYGRSTDLVKVFKYAAPLMHERGAVAEAARETGRSKPTIKTWSMLGNAWLSVEEEGRMDAQEFRKQFNAIGASTKVVAAVLEAREYATLEEFLMLITPELPETPEDSSEEVTEEVEEVKEDKTPLVDVVLAALPHLSNDDLARVWDALAELAATKAVELV